MPNLRARLVRFIREGPPKKLKNNPVQTSSSPDAPPTPEAASTPFRRPSEVAESPPASRATTTSQNSRGEICRTVRQWRLQFNGNTDAEEFLEKLVDLQENSDISTSDLLPALYEVFQGNALAWYRNNRSLWRSWSDFLTDFKQFYLPADYHDALEEQIYKRRQRPGEPGRDYVVALQTLTRRHGEYTQERVLHRIYGNLLPEYRQYIRRSDLGNVRDLVARIDEFEKLQTEMQHQVSVIPSQPPRTTRSSPPPMVPRSEAPAVREREVPPDTAGVLSPTHRRNVARRTYEDVSRYVPVDRRRETFQRHVPAVGEREVPPDTAGAPSHTPRHTEPHHTVMADDHAPNVRRRTYGGVVQQENRNHQDPRASHTATASPPSTQASICWRCGKAGHYRAECRAPPRLFCSRCGRNGIMTRDCRCHNSEN